MVARTTNRLHQRNLRSTEDASGSGIDDFNDEERPVSAGDDNRAPLRQSMHSTARSSVVREALMDGTSKLSRFLFTGNSGNIDDNDMPCNNDPDAFCYALALEPMKVR